ncbi:hypothetical protein G6F32_015108 [Rhizopus arrhizus]|nr:hypothetical protein G6F32_015108 [Rhizopus arrhizus]
MKSTRPGRHRSMIPSRHASASSTRGTGYAGDPAWPAAGDPPLGRAGREPVGRTGGQLRQLGEWFGGRLGAGHHDLRDPAGTGGRRAGIHHRDRRPGAALSQHATAVDDHAVPERRPGAGREDHRGDRRWQDGGSVQCAGFERRQPLDGGGPGRAPG